MSCNHKTKQIKASMKYTIKYIKMKCSDCYLFIIIRSMTVQIDGDCVDWIMIERHETRWLSTRLDPNHDLLTTALEVLKFWWNKQKKNKKLSATNATSHVLREKCSAYHNHIKQAIYCVKKISSCHNIFKEPIKWEINKSTHNIPKNISDFLRSE